LCDDPRRDYRWTGGHLHDGGAIGLLWIATKKSDGVPGTTHFVAESTG